MIWLRQEIARHAKDLVAKGEMKSSIADHLDSVPGDRVYAWYAHERDSKPLIELIAEHDERKKPKKKQARKKPATKLQDQKWLTARDNETPPRAEQH